MKWSLALTFKIKVCVVSMNVFARFDKIPLIAVRVIKITKRFGRTNRIHKELQKEISNKINWQ